MPPTEITDRLVSWASDVDDGTVAQALKASRLPVVAGHVALMPDAHVGIGATIGSVIPTDGAIIPSAVGVDIGCGMAAVRLDVREDQLPDDLEPLLARIERVVPAGVGQGTAGGTDAAGRWLAAHPPPTDLGDREARRAHEQFGSLGSGNHFFELCVDESGAVWVLLHSGSRGIGNQLAQRHMAKARGLATSAGQAREGQLGLIPGSMGTRSYVVRGKGSERSWRSCSHGAGRRLSRTAAKKRYTPRDLAEQMQGEIWLHDRARALVDEIPSAYKDIDQVMADQRDLVDVVHELRQVLNYKGT